MNNKMGEWEKLPSGSFVLKKPSKFFEQTFREQPPTIQAESLEDRIAALEQQVKSR